MWASPDIVEKEIDQDQEQSNVADSNYGCGGNPSNAKLADDPSRGERVPAVVADVGEVLRLAQEVRVGPSAVRPPHDPVGVVSRGRGMSMSPCCGLPRSFGDLFRLRAADHDGLAHGGGRAAMPSDDGCRHTHRLLGVLGGSHVGQEAHAEGCRGR